MVGYLKAYFPDLRMFEYRDYKAFYCGICLDIKEEYGELSRFFLNYDITFMAILLSTYEEDSVKKSHHRCILNPLQKKVIYRSDYTKYFAAMNMIFTYHKLEDAQKDEHSKLSASLKVLLKRKYNSVRKEYPREAAIFDSYMERLTVSESENCQDFDYMGRLFGETLREIIAPMVSVKEEQQLVGTLFDYIGQWIYSIDALDDLKEDIAKGCYNPMQDLYENHRDNFLETVEQYFNRMLFGMIETYDNMQIKAHPGIINNVICIAIRRKTSDILTKYKKEEEDDVCKKSR